MPRKHQTEESEEAKWLAAAEADHGTISDTTALTATEAQQGQTADTVAAEPEGWGWWTAFKSLKQWQDGINQLIAAPPLDMSYLVTLTPLQLAQQLATFGGYLVYLNTQQGILTGEILALRESYEAALEALRGQAPKEESRTEAAKASWALNHPDYAETLRQAKRLQIEYETIHAAQAGLIKAYEKGWETVSRVITSTGIEAGMSTNRSA